MSAWKKCHQIARRASLSRSQHVSFFGKKKSSPIASVHLQSWHDHFRQRWSNLTVV
ncbi:hypothetical protein ALC57_12369 [Trachymyrmex cornetzi]|uniref:Uncharacterized protein n=1 Tax=Trachymyrmex cornetzi TaxID=471704 RepID=A0A195DQY0_9HYME|nr:hypothetical protein ALC57_12369 [Trachymyrmex cornetzi]